MKAITTFILVVWPLLPLLSQDTPGRLITLSIIDKGSVKRTTMDVSFQNQILKDSYQKFQFQCNQFAWETGRKLSLELDSSLCQIGVGPFDDLCDVELLLSNIDSIKITNNDYIMAFIMAHGFIDSDSEPNSFLYPKLYNRDLGDKSSFVDLERIFRAIYSKSPKFCLSLINTCQSSRASTFFSSPPRSYLGSGLGAVSTINMDWDSYVHSKNNLEKVMGQSGIYELFSCRNNEVTVFPEGEIPLMSELFFNEIKSSTLNGSAASFQEFLDHLNTSYSFAHSCSKIASAKGNNTFFYRRINRIDQDNRPSVEKESQLIPCDDLKRLGRRLADCLDERTKGQQGISSSVVPEYVGVPSARSLHEYSNLSLTKTNELEYSRFLKLADDYFFLDEYSKAKNTLDKLISRFGKLTHPYWYASVKQRLGQYFKQTEQPDQAKKYFDDSEEIFRKLGVEGSKSTLTYLR